MQFLFSPIHGALSDRFGRRRTLFVYLALMSLPVFYLMTELSKYGWVMPVSATAENRPAVPAALVTALWVSTLLYSVFMGLMYGTRSAIFMDVTNPRVAGDEMADIKRLFTPEFRNRLDALVSFKALDENVILRVVDKFLLQLETQLAEKKVEVTFTDKLRKHLGKKGFDPLMGARPMQRLIQDTIRRALADELLFGRLVDGGRLTVDLDEKDEVVLDIQPLPKKEGKSKPEEATAG